MLDDTRRKVPQTAVALAYQSGTPAPKVVAKGSGLIADQIISTAREHGVFVHESKELVALLMDVDLDRIPALKTGMTLKWNRGGKSSPCCAASAKRTS